MVLRRILDFRQGLLVVEPETGYAAPEFLRYLNDTGGYISEIEKEVTVLDTTTIATTAAVVANEAAIVLSQADATQALFNSATAQATADGKITVFDQSPTPVGDTGDLWYKVDVGRWYIARSNGSNQIIAGKWELVADSAIGVAQTAAAQATLDAAGAQATADGKIVSFYQTTAPIADGIGDLWTDTDAVPVAQYRWNGTIWQLVSNLSLNTNELTDGANLGGTAIWSGVSGVGTPDDNADVTATASRTVVSAFPVIEIKQGEAGHTGIRTVAHTLYVGTTVQTGVTWSIQTNDTGGICTVDSGTGVVSLSGIAVSGAYTIRAAKGGFNTDRAVNVTYVPTPPTATVSARTGFSSNSSGYGTGAAYSTLLSLTLTSTPIGRMFFNSYGLSGGSKSEPLTFSGSNGTWQARLKLTDGGTVTYPVETTATVMVSSGTLAFADFSALFQSPLTVAVGGTVTVAIEVKRTAGDANILTANNKLDVNVIAS